MEVNLLSITIALALILIIGGVFFYKYKTSPSSEDRESAKKFLKGMRDVLYNKALDIIKNFDYTKYDSLLEIEAEVINQIITELKAYITAELEKSTDLLSVLAIRCLNTSMIEDFIRELLEQINPSDEMLKYMSPSMIENIELANDEDKELEEKFSDEKEYNEEEMETLPEAEEESIPEEELEKLNPQTDEEEEFNEEDSSMEVIDNEDIYIDKSGRPRSKLTGKWVKMEK